MAQKPHAFGKFMNTVSGAKKKEAYRQEKRQARAEREAIGEEARQRKNEEMRGMRNNAQTSNATNKKGTSSRNQGPVSPVNKRPDYSFNQHPSKQTSTRSQGPSKSAVNKTKATEDEIMPLNKFIAYAGVCSRREAVDIIKKGDITVNKQKIDEPAFKVSSKDEVRLKNKRIFPQRNLVYILMNKPKDYITTAKDPEGRKTVLDLINIPERIFPVGRLDRNTTGVLLFTNDGELAQKLTHPSFEVKKVYEAKLDKPLIKKDFDTILKGVTLEDGVVAADVLAYADSKDKSVIGIEIHSGKNRIVRRIFEHLGYDVRNLDRVMFANLTKKTVDRGKWRFLSEKEVRLLKFMNKSFLRNAK